HAPHVFLPRIWPSAPIFLNVIMAGHRRNQQRPRRHCYFGLMRATARDAGTAVPPATEPSHFELVAALEVEDVARLVRGRHFEATTLDDLAGKLHLFGVRCRHAASRRP